MTCKSNHISCRNTNWRKGVINLLVKPCKTQKIRLIVKQEAQNNPKPFIYFNKNI